MTLGDNTQTTVGGVRRLTGAVVRWLAALKLTIAQYLTPGDVSIQEVGITPDVLLQPGFCLSVTPTGTSIFHSSASLEKGPTSSGGLLIDMKGFGLRPRLSPLIMMSMFLMSSSCCAA